MGGETVGATFEKEKVAHMFDGDKWQALLQTDPSDADLVFVIVDMPAYRDKAVAALQARHATHWQMYLLDILFENNFTPRDGRDKNKDPFSWGFMLSADRSDLKYFCWSKLKSLIEDPLVLTVIAWGKGKHAVRASFPATVRREAAVILAPICTDMKVLADLWYSYNIGAEELLVQLKAAHKLGDTDLLCLIAVAHPALRDEVCAHVIAHMERIDPYGFHQIYRTLPEIEAVVWDEVVRRETLLNRLLKRTAAAGFLVETVKHYATRREAAADILLSRRGTNVLDLIEVLVHCPDRRRQAWKRIQRSKLNAHLLAQMAKAVPEWHKEIDQLVQAIAVSDIAPGVLKELVGLDLGGERLKLRLIANEADQSQANQQLSAISKAIKDLKS